MERIVHDRMRRIEQDHWWFAVRREILAARIGRLKLPPSAQILEVGCGSGGNLRMLAGFGEVRAVEPDQEAREHARAAGFDVREGQLPDGLPAYDTAFDLVAALDVIEHVDEDLASVRRIGEHLKPGGRFIATVPANPWMWSRHDEQHHHKRRYDREAFVGLFEAAGLVVERATYFNTLLFPAISAVRLSHRLFGGGEGDDDLMPGALVNGILRRVFGLEKALLDHLDLPFGVSILLIARRPA